MGNGCLFRLSTNKPNKCAIGPNFQKVSCHQCQCSDSSQISSQDDCNYNPSLSLYKIITKCNRTELTIYDTENLQENVKILYTKMPISESASTITQLPNGDLFVLSYGGAAFIIDRSYRVKILQWGVDCSHFFAIYFDKNIYLFGGRHFSKGKMALSRKFDINKKIWISLASLPKPDFSCHSVIFWFTSAFLAPQFFWALLMFFLNR